MPELPEVETIRRDLQPRITGRAVERITINNKNDKPKRLAPALRRQLRGRRVEALDRHGKRLIARLDDGRDWVLQLGMTGLLLLRPCDKPPCRFERASAVFDDGTELRFADMRYFGRWSIVADAREGSAPDALSEEFTPDWLLGKLRRRRTPVKAALLDQGVAAGVGNLYADEALWRAGIHPKTPANGLGAEAAERLHGAVLETLREATDDRGSSFKVSPNGYQYLDAFGEEGRYRHRVYRRDGEPCERCGQLIERDPRIIPRGRASHYCPVCQRA